MLRIVEEYVVLKLRYLILNGFLDSQMSQSQDTVPELVIDEGIATDSTPDKDGAANEVVNQGASTAAAVAAPAKPQKAKKRAYTKRGGASASGDGKEKQDESDEDKVCVVFLAFFLMNLCDDGEGVVVRVGVCFLNLMLVGFFLS